MIETELGSLPSHFFKGKLLIAIEEKWNNFFVSEEITFEVRIDKNKNFVLVGPQVRLQPTKQNPGSKEVSNDKGI